MLKKFADKIEKYLIRFIVLGMVVLVLVQGMMTRDSLRFYLSWSERMEGQALEYPVSKENVEPDKNQGMDINSPYALLSLSLKKYSSLPRAVILINGEKVDDFENQEVDLKLMAGDIVEIDATFYDFPVEIKVNKVSDNLAFPEKDQIFTANDSIVMIGKTVVK